MFSASRTAASLLALALSFTTKISPMRDTNRMIAVSAHGRMRLLNGFEARLRLLFTGSKTSSRAYRQAKLSRKEYTALGNNRKRRKIYTHPGSAGFRMIGLWDV